MIIAFMGNDGSGKTTLAKELTYIFKKVGFEVIYKHEYEYMFLKFLFKIARKRVERERKKMIVERERSWKYYLWPFLVWFDMFFQWLYFKIFKKGAIIILDRTLYDHYISFEYLGYSTQFTKWLYLHFPKPDIGIVLWVEPKIAFERKKETHSYPLKFYKEQTKRYLKLSKDLGFPTVYTNQDLKKTLEDTLRIIFRDDFLLKLFVLRTEINGILYETIELYNLHKINPYFDKLLLVCKKKEQRFIKTLEFINSLNSSMCSNGKFILIKTYRLFKQVEFNDIDVLVRGIQPEDLYGILKQRKKGRILLHKKYAKIDYCVEDLYPIEFQWRIEWSKNIKFIDENYITSLKRRMHNVELDVASPEAEILIIFSHLLFGNATFLKLSEYRYLLHLLRQANRKRFIEHAYRMGWGDDCLWILKTIEKMNNSQFPWFLPFLKSLKIFFKYLPLCRGLDEKISFLKIFIVFQIFRRCYIQLKLSGWK